MKSRKPLLYKAGAAVLLVIALAVFWQTLYGQLIMDLLWDDVIMLQPIYLLVSIAGGVLGGLLGPLAGGSWKKGVRAGCWLLPLLMFLARLAVIVSFVLSPGSSSFMQ